MGSADDITDHGQFLWGARVTAMTTINFRFKFIAGGGRSFVATLVACERRPMLRQAMEAIGRRCQIVAAALWLPEPFITEPGIRTQ